MRPLLAFGLLVVIAYQGYVLSVKQGLRTKNRLDNVINLSKTSSKNTEALKTSILDENNSESFDLLDQNDVPSLDDQNIVSKIFSGTVNARTSFEIALEEIETGNKNSAV